MGDTGYHQSCYTSLCPAVRCTSPSGEWSSWAHLKGCGDKWELDAMRNPSTLSGLQSGVAASGKPFRLGSRAHLDAFCRMLLDTHNPYHPAVRDWPELDGPARDRLVSLPIWDIAVQ